MKVHCQSRKLMDNFYMKNPFWKGQDLMSRELENSIAGINCSNLSDSRESPYLILN